MEDQPGARDVDGTSGSHVTAVVHVTKIFPVDQVVGGVGGSDHHHKVFQVPGVCGGMMR